MNTTKSRRKGHQQVGNFTAAQLLHRMGITKTPVEKVINKLEISWLFNYHVT